MRRVEVPARPNATKLVKSQGLVYSDVPSGSNNEPYWPDNRYYSFTSAEIELLETASKDVFDMCCEAAEYLVEHPQFVVDKMAIPAFAVEQIKQSWNRDWGSVYGRFDISFGGLDNPDPRLRVPKFYEFNADTPTSLVETACIQWYWLEQTGHGQDQFNSVAENLVAAWRRNLELIEKHVGHKVTVHFATGRGDDSGEDLMNTILLMDTCRQAGWATKGLFMDQIAMCPEGRFYDQHGAHIDVIFKLYPYEFMVLHDFGEPCFQDMARIGERSEDSQGATIWIEPPYKMLWSNKALFAVLWMLFKDDPRSKWLLPTYFESEKPESLTSFARKPIFSREGWGITLRQGDQVLEEQATDMYGSEGYIVQELSLPAGFEAGDGTVMYAVPGLWFIDGDPSGMGIREDASPITSNRSVFAPHSISDGPISYTKRPIPSLKEIQGSLGQDDCLSGQGVQDGHGGSALSIPDYIYSIVNNHSSVGQLVVQESVP